jgi:hypothetical protein
MWLPGLQPRLLAVKEILLLLLMVVMMTMTMMILTFFFLAGDCRMANGTGKGDVSLPNLF